MSDDLLHYYKIERSFVRKDADEFARAHPDVAERLRLGPDSADPHVERLIEAFAFLTARVHRKLDDDFPELTDALLNTLYPHYLRPVPSTSIVEFAPDPSSAAAYVVDRDSQLMSERAPGGRGVSCTFRTTQKVTLWPISVTSAKLGPVELDLPDYAPPAGAQACLRIELSTLAKDLPFAKLGLRELRFFLSGDRAFLLYELLLNNVIEAFVTDAAPNPKNRRVRRIDLPCVSPCGFRDDEALLPSPPRSFPGYRLLSEYFAFPEKFLFVDVAGLDRFEPSTASQGGTMVLHLLLNNSPSRELEREVSRQTFRLGCTPIVNLFTHEADPIKLSHTQLDYVVTPDARSPGAYEVYSIDRVQATTSGGQPVDYRPFFAPSHRVNGANPLERYWYSREQPSRRCCLYLFRCR